MRAVVVRSSTTVPGEQLRRELQEAVKAGVGRHAYPRAIDFVETLPRTATRKIRRFALGDGHD